MLTASVDHLSVLVRIVRHSTTGRRIQLPNHTIETACSRRQAYNRIYEVGDDDSVDNSGGTKRGATCTAIHSPAEEAQPDRERKARQRVSIIDGGSDARQQVSGR